MNNAIMMTATLLAAATNPAEINSDLVRQRRGGTNLKVSKPFGKGPWLPPMQKLTNRKFMSSSQKAAFDAGEEIWV